MATINLGNIKFKWQGAYNGATAYTVDDVVSYNGSSYICIANSTGNLPTNTSYFEQMSSAGTNGTNGTDLTTTLTTQGDILYRDGSGLQRLGAGTSGQALITGGAGANPSWGSVSSDYVLISDTTIANNTVNTFTLNSSLFDGSTYDFFDILIDTQAVSTDSSSIFMAFSDDDGSTTLSNGHSYSYITGLSVSGATPTIIRDSNGSEAYVSFDGWRLQGSMIRMTFAGLNRSRHKNYLLHVAKTNHDTDTAGTYGRVFTHQGGGFFNSTASTNNALKFWTNSSVNFGTTYLKVYGYK